MELILARHGNTFGPSDRVTWVGSKNDLPLVEKGFEQAEKLAQFFLETKIFPSAVYCSLLQRTLVYANHVIQKMQLNLTPITDIRLNEIDYGNWSGLTPSEIIEQFGEEALEGWNRRGQWPAQGNWGGSEAQMILEAQSFANEMSLKYGTNETVLVVTSQGRMRYFLKLIPNEYDKRIRTGEFRVKTGHYCRFVRKNESLQKSESWELTAWDKNPSFSA